MRYNCVNGFLVTVLVFLVALGCSNGSNSSSGSTSKNSDKPAKLESYSIKGVKFAWYKVRADLKGDDLIATAQKIHDQEPDTQLILVDDDSEMADYISYAKAISGQGDIDKPMPVDWADKHIIANVQKYTSGKFVLCEGYGSKEIADLK